MSMVDVPVWHKTPRGGWLRRGALDPEHPESTRSYILRKGLNPDDFGVPVDKPYDTLKEGQGDG